jgi:hypothetical protein
VVGWSQTQHTPDHLPPHRIYGLTSMQTILAIANPIH